MAKVLVEVDGPIRTVTMNRPEKRNALDGEMLAELAAAFPSTPGENERVAVLRAAGKVFCAGMDLAGDGEALGQPTSIEDTLRAIERFPPPVVAVVQGHAIAGGNEIALHCDFVVASEAAQFGMSLAQIGLAPTWFLTKKVMEVAGPVAAREILLLGDPLPARRMHALGLIARVAAPEALEQEVASVVERLAANAPLSLRSMKRMLLRQMTFRDHIAHGDLNEEVRDLARSADAGEGVAARLERRPPRFTGR